jgi:glycosyltransferase involved in cell wall biosynthesis
VAAIEDVLAAMKIGIDLRYVVRGASGGLSLYLRELLPALFRRHPEQEFFVFTTIFNHSLLGETIPPNVERVTLPGASFLSDMARFCSDRRIDVLLRYPIEADLDYPLDRQLFFVPDLQHEMFPEFFPPSELRSRRLAYGRALAAGGGVSTLSEYARRTILEHPWTRCSDVFVASPALLTREEDGVAGPIQRPETAREFLLYPANLWPHKNHRRLLEAFARLSSRTSGGLELVLTGHPRGWDELRAEFAHLPVRHLGFVSDAVLQALLKDARALVFFSLYEGFGMPLLEAFAAGTPVVCSNTTSLPEVGGDAVLSGDPLDVGGMSSLMSRILDDEPLRQHLVARGRTRLEQYRWEQSADDLWAGCVRVAERAAARASASSVEVVRESPLVSIVTPSMNQGRFLKRTIESVLGQTYPRIEYVVMDGGSRDESVDVLRSYGAKLAWVSEPDKGQTDAINRGFERSRGDIRAYLNSDDVLSRDAVEKVVAHLAAHPEWDLVYGRAVYIDPEDRVTGRYSTAEYSFDRLLTDYCICQPATFWRYRIAERVGPFDADLHYVMDYEYWLRIDLAGGRIAHVEDDLAAYRLYPETKTLAARNKIYDEILQVRQRYGARIDRNYFWGLWDHRIRERRDGWPQLLRPVPRAYYWAGYLHHTWHHRSQLGLAVRNMVNSGLRSHLRPRAGRLDPVLAPIAQKVHAWRYRARGVGSLYGFWSDNWLGPTCQLYGRRQSSDRPYYLAGTAAIDMTLTVVVGDAIVAVRPLLAGRYDRIELPPGAADADRLVLRFSKHVIDGARRRISFRLQDTNLFAEQDTA